MSRLPPDCPVIPLGFDSDELWLVDQHGGVTTLTDLQRRFQLARRALAAAPPSSGFTWWARALKSRQDSGGGDPRSQSSSNIPSTTIMSLASSDMPTFSSAGSVSENSRESSSFVTLARLIKTASAALIAMMGRSGFGIARLLLGKRAPSTESHDDGKGGAA